MFIELYNGYGDIITKEVVFVWHTRNNIAKLGFFISKFLGVVFGHDGLFWKLTRVIYIYIYVLIEHAFLIN